MAVKQEVRVHCDIRLAKPTSAPMVCSLTAATNPMGAIVRTSGISHDTSRRNGGSSPIRSVCISQAHCLPSKDECSWSDCDGLDVKPSIMVKRSVITDEYVPGHI